MGSRSRRWPPENVLPARGAHRFRLCGSRRGIWPGRRRGRDCALPRDPFPRDAHRARRARPVCEPARSGTHRAAVDPGANQHVSRDRSDSDQGLAAAVSELRRNFDHHCDGGARRVARTWTPAGGAMKVIIAGGGTGGHLFPAVALGEEMIRERPGIDVLFVGTTAGMEAKWLPDSRFNYELFTMHGIRGHSLIERARASVEFLRAIALALSLLRRFRPNLVVSAGGYASASMGAAAIITRTPLVLMEQNTRPGLVNRVLSRFAKKICVGFSDSLAHFSSSNVEVTGNPTRNRYLPDRSRVEGAPLQILVLGGSSGAHRLNLGVVGAFKIYGKSVINLNLNVVHQTGEADVELVKRAYSEMQFTADVVPFIDDVASAMHRADLIIARSGAMTVTDIALAARPAVFVPYPFHKDMQQLHNARVIEKRGGAIIVVDDDQLAPNLARELDALLRNPSRLIEMGEQAHQEAHP